jgi:hypothetical protein
MLWDDRHRSSWNRAPASFPIPLGSISGNTFSGDGTTVVLHHALYENTFDDNIIEDGARVWAWYWTKIKPNPDISYYNDDTLIILEDHDLLTEFPVPNGPTSREVNYFSEVTEDLGRPLEPPMVRVVIRWYTESGHRLMVTDFLQADLSMDTNVLTYNIWPDIQGVLNLYIEDWPWEELVDWEGGQW